MRSRFSAFARGDATYLWRTLHHDHDDREGDEQSFHERIAAQRVRYVALQVLDDRPADSDGTALVLFLANVQDRGADVSFVERSYFVHDGEGWRYIAGETRSIAEISNPRAMKLDRWSADQ